MDIQQIIEQDPRIVEMKKQYNVLIGQKNQMIINISHIEADIIKLSGAYETLANSIVEQIKANIAKQMEKQEKEPEPVEPPEAPIAEENEDDGFVEVVADPMDFETEAEAEPPSAENTRPLGAE